eukprot:Gb_05344 [translate_table: standard]
MKLLGILTLAELCRNSCRLNNLNAGLSHSVTRSHLIVHLRNRPIKCCVTILFVHVVVPSSTLIPKPDTIILDLGWLFLKDLIDSKYLPIALFHLLQLPQKVPEFGLCPYFICCP